VKGQGTLVRFSAAGALGELGDRRAIEPLEELLGDEEPDVREAAREALAQLRRSNEGSP